MAEKAVEIKFEEYREFMEEHGIKCYAVYTRTRYNGYIVYPVEALGKFMVELDVPGGWTYYDYNTGDDSMGNPVIPEVGPCPEGYRCLGWDHFHLNDPGSLRVWDNLALVRSELFDAVSELYDLACDEDEVEEDEPEPETRLIYGVWWENGECYEDYRDGFLSFHTTRKGADADCNRRERKFEKERGDWDNDTFEVKEIKVIIDKE